MFVRLLLIFSSTLLVQVSFAQSAKQDSITHRYDSLSKAKLHKLNSSNSRPNNKIDSAQRKVDEFLNPHLNHLTFKESKSRIEQRKAKKDSVEFRKTLNANKEILKVKIDSLDKKGISSQQYALQLDSLNKVRYNPASDSAAIKRSTAKSKINEQQGKVNRILNPDLNSLLRSGLQKAGFPAEHFAL